ncbi:3-ketoacyl-CoA thiolase [Venturia nashicola]|uniref:3-ketoacyl-CoA thiolase n=1 Tax=Venturia nashicola TaxID=86259 RepID=A0A4Z1PQD9_9PEZI|nr:3-ketoacyl-CoA thiolase [Venturia nashicola]
MPGIDNTRELFTYARFLRSWMENNPLMISLNRSTATPCSTSLTTTTTTTATTATKVKAESGPMEAPTPVHNGGAYLHAWGCPLCHRDPIEPRVANCGHTFCMMCLKDVQVTAELFKYAPRCNLCLEDISNQHPIAFNASHTLPPLAPAPSSPPDGQDDQDRLAPCGSTVAEAFASMHQRARDPRNFYASGLSGAQSAYQHHYDPYHHHHHHHHQQQYVPHTQQLPPHMQSMPRYDGPQGYLGPMPSSDQIVNTIEYSPGGSVSTVSEPKTSQSDTKPTAVKGTNLKDQGFYIKGELDRDGQARFIIQQNGGRLTASAAKNTHYIVMGKGAKKTKAMKENFAGVILDETSFWDLMQQKVGGHTINVQLQAQQEGDDKRLESEEAKLRAELAKLEKKTVEVKRKLEQLTETKTGVKKQKIEAEGFSELAKFTGEKTES